MDGLSNRITLVLAAAALVAVAGCTQATTPPSSTAEPAGQGATQGQQLAESKCTMCHTYDRVAQAKKDEAGWSSTMDRMVDHGLVVTDEEKAAILEYLVSQGK